MDYRTMFDANFVGAWDLPKGKDTIVEIEAVKGETLTAQGNKKSRKPVLKFKGKDKKFALNKTNAKLVSGMYGNDTRAWVGKKIALYPTTTLFGKETMDCIRIRPTVPGGSGGGDFVEGAQPSREQLEQRARLEQEQQREPGED